MILWGVVYGKRDLERLREIAEERKRLQARARAFETDRYRLVMAALDVGHTPREVAEALGISVQSLRRFIDRRQG